MLSVMERILLGLVFAGCSSNSARTVDAASSDTPAGSMTLTSPAFAEGEAIPVANTCKGANTSPALAWTGAPRSAQSFAMVLTDLSISMAHWVIYDIPDSATELPAGVENVDAPASVPGARQIVSIHAPIVGYYGPCPPRPPAHTYQFAVYALDTATLPGVSAQSTRPEAIAAIQAHRLDSGTLTGTFTTP